MEHNQQDQDLLKLIKKSKRKKRLQNIFFPLLVTVLLLVTCGTLLLNYFNLGPFTGDKIAGIPDNHLRLNQMDNGITELLFLASNSYQFNYTGSGVELWLEHYQNGEKKSTKQLGPVFYPDHSKEIYQYTGLLSYGLGNGTDYTPSSFSYSSIVNGATTRDLIKLADYGFNEDSIFGYSYGLNPSYEGAVFYSQDSLYIKKDAEIDLLTITDSGTLKSTTDRKEQFKDIPNGLVLYLVFK